MGQPAVFFEDSLYQKAWERLAKTTTDAAGVDGVRIEDISSPDEFIKEIQAKILTNAYRPSPVKTMELKRGNKVRTIGILTLEDRFVHTLVKCWLEPLCLPRFHPRSFAYQPGKSASQAIELLEHWINEGYEWIGETDIRSFFDEIDHHVLAQQLRYFTKDEEKIAFILYLYSGQGKGIVQGSPLSPLLANVYLHLFDEYMAANGQPYLRFSDDLVILDQSNEQVKQRLQKMEQFLLTLGLSIHPEKTAVKHLSETFEFLGFRFDEEGRKVAVKGVESLREKMDGVKQYPAGEREGRYEMILRGWMQYYESIPWETFDEPEWLLFVADFETDRDKISDAYTKATSRLSRKDITTWHAQRLYRLASVLELRKDQLYWLTCLHTLGVPLSTEDEQQLYTVYQLTKTDWLSLVTYLERCVSEQGDEAYDDLINYCR
ncbi:reverse transcriptase domain-containing protein [Geobacillus sp. YF-1]|uniref:reverse transcriptase domain-containing protein n=1 Tax=Geobacillus sp. YF-1 TaxID=3457480 RepID=UPI004045B49B